MFDPNYVSVPAVLLRHTVTIFTGYAVHVEHHLRSDAMQIDHKTQKINIRAGLGLDNFQWLMWRAIVRLLLGKDSAPEFLEYPDDQPKLRLIEGGSGLDLDGLPLTMPFPRLSSDESEYDSPTRCAYVEGEPALALVRAHP